MTTANLQIREDVQRALDKLLADHFSHPEWNGYELAKRRLSVVCGWDAPPELFDQNQYDAAIRAYVTAAGI